MSATKLEERYYRVNFKLHTTREKTRRKTMEDGRAVKIVIGTEWSIGHDDGNSFTDSIQQIP
jgi:NifB/MoaA-like Fe-S oxidoreductase